MTRGESGQQYEFVKLKSFLRQFGSFSESFWAQYSHPLLLEDGEYDDRQVHILQATGGPIRLGRDDPCELRIPDARISSEHARFHPPADDQTAWRVEDLGSTNGVILDERLLEPGSPTDLKDGQALLLGPGLKYRFFLPASFKALLDDLGGREPSQEEDPDLGGGTVRVQQPVPQALIPDDDDDEIVMTEPEPSDPPPPAEARSSQELFLYCEPFDPLPIPDGATVVVGRKPGGADWVLPHPELSRRHLEFRRQGSSVYVRDLGSTNGSHVGGVRIGPARIRLYPRRNVAVGPFNIWLDGPPRDSEPRLITTNRLEGDLSKVRLGRLMLEIESEERAGTLRIDGDSVQGEVVFSGGKPCKAKIDDGEEGTRAIQLLLRAKRGKFLLESSRKDDIPPTRRIRRTFSQIVPDMPSTESDVGQA